MTRLLPLLLLLSLAGGCGETRRPPLEGARIGGAFTLTDGDGRRVTERSFPGKWRIVYFGYTYCPDVCPTDLAAIGAATRLLREQAPAVAAKLVPLFVTVDPARDTTAVVKTYAATFGPDIVGLTGTAGQVAAATRAWGVYVAKGPVQPGGAYLVDHSRQTYLMDPDNRPIALLPADKGAGATAAEIRRWVR